MTRIVTTSAARAQAVFAELRGSGKPFTVIQRTICEPIPGKLLSAIREPQRRRYERRARYLRRLEAHRMFAGSITHRLVMQTIFKTE